MSQFDLSIVIVSYNVRDLLEWCLDSVGAQYIEPLQTTDGTQHDASGICTLSSEILVVDNASSDGSAAMVQKKFPAAHLIANTENRGFAAANNQGFAQAHGRYLLMLNPDTRVRAGALETLVKFMDAHPRAGACGGKLVYADGSLQQSAFQFPTLAQIFLDSFPLNWRLTDSRVNGRYPRAGYARGEPFPIDHPLGADLMVRREVAEKIGWLDEKFFIYCEEIDWCMRIKHAGWEIWCVPQAEIVHYEAQSTQQFREAMFVELWRARLRLFDKHYSRAFRWAARQIVRLGVWQKARDTRATARAGRVTQDEMEQRLNAYAQVARLASETF